VSLQLQTQAPPIGQFHALFETTGWDPEHQVTSNQLAEALANSWYVVAAYDGEQLVGFGRVVTDRTMHAMIYDLIVHPAYQNRGLGTQILEQLVARCLEARIRDIQLFCARGKRTFYEKRGFVVRPADAPGMQYARLPECDKSRLD
jgi:GNAT superfamily N-acetyltransferase